jgi:hypothetical protein
MTVMNALDALDVVKADLDLRVVDTQNNVPILSVVGVKP